MYKLLFPSSYFSINKVDEDLIDEYNAAKLAGFDIVLFSYEKWFNNSKLVLNNNVEDCNIIYRGWMMSPEQYKNFYNKCNEQGLHLLTSPTSYNLFHIFPNIYDKIKNDTARIVTYPLHSQIDVSSVPFDRFMVKDYVKSVKDSRFPKYFINGVEQSSFDESMKLFYELRGDLLIGGICIKEYLDLTEEEVRVFYLNGEVLAINGYKCDLVDKYRDLGSPYYTIDFAKLNDGSWKIIEVGDGSVSGLDLFSNKDGYYKSMYDKLMD